MAHPLLRFGAAAAATLAAVAALGAWPTYAWAGPTGFVGMALAAGLSFAGALLGYLPVALASGGEPNLERRAQASLVGLGVRMLWTLVGVAVVLFTDSLHDEVAFVAWVGAFYVALLALESVVLVRDVRRGGRGGIASA